MEWQLFSVSPPQGLELQQDMLIPSLLQAQRFGLRPTIDMRSVPLAGDGSLVFARFP